jgi:hypothetical protein
MYNAACTAQTKYGPGGGRNDPRQGVTASEGEAEGDLPLALALGTGKFTKGGARR